MVEAGAGGGYEFEGGEGLKDLGGDGGPMDGGDEGLDRTGVGGQELVLRERRVPCFEEVELLGACGFQESNGWGSLEYQNSWELTGTVISHWMLLFDTVHRAREVSTCGGFGTLFYTRVLDNEFGLSVNLPRGNKELITGGDVKM